MTTGAGALRTTCSATLPTTILSSPLPSVLEFGMLSGVIDIYRRLSGFQHVNNVECRVEVLRYSLLDATNSRWSK